MFFAMPTLPRHTRPLHRFAYACLLGCTLPVVQVVHAEVIRLPPALVTEQTAPAPASVGLPARGESKAGVLTRFGAPAQQHEPVGGGSPQQPPITRWDYSTFSVFFENDTVIDVVLRDHPRRVLDPDALQRQP